MDKQSIYYEKVLSAAYRVWRDTHKDGSVRKMGTGAVTVAHVIADECEQLPQKESYILNESTNLEAALRAHRVRDGSELEGYKAPGLSCGVRC